MSFQIRKLVLLIKASLSTTGVKAQPLKCDRTFIFSWLNVKISWIYKYNMHMLLYYSEIINIIVTLVQITNK